MKVFILSSEAVPFAKTGGLADVAGSLPAALKRLGLDVRLCLPRHRVSFEKNHPTRPLLDDLDVPLGEAILRADIIETRNKDEIPVYLINREDMYDRPNLYGNEKGDYYDNLERFSFFAHCTLEMMQRLDLFPDIIHCHDWQTGLVPALLKGPYKKSPNFSSTATTFTIHNLGYQGIFPAKKFQITGLNAADFFHPDGVEFWGNMSLLKAGIVYADAVTTVSPTYSREIQTPEYGMGMEGILQSRRGSLYGILNGVDYNEWNPTKDVHIAANYSPKRMAGKTKCKESLIQEMNLDLSLTDKPLLGMISRLDAQKGLDILVAILNRVLILDIGLIILGSGDEKIQAAIQKAANRHSGKVGIYIGFNESLARRIMAGVDIFLIPSRYEPCGLTQIYALKYGTVPVVRATGGLNDTITPFDKDTGNGNGFQFGPYEPKAFLTAIKQAIDLYGDAKTWKRIQANGMQENFSWDRSAGAYMEVYRSVLKAKEPLPVSTQRQNTKG